jgi:ABC-type nitrate/sulfonate/bicarbonate transport system substrate-binding protein
MIKILKEGQFVKKLFFALTLVAFFLAVTPTFSYALDKLRASHQPAKHALPTVLGIEKGWFKELGLDVSFSYFSAGMSQVEAGIAGEWEVGAMGSPPAIFGGIKYGLLSIGTSITQEMIEWLLINKKNYEAFNKNPKEWLKGKTILTTTISTGHYSLLANLKKWGLTEKDVKIVHMDQSAIIAAFAAGEGDLYQAWAPFCYLMQGRGAMKVADGRTAGITIPGMLVATPKFAKKSPELVAKWLQGYLRGVLYEYQYPGDAALYLQQYYKMVGIDLPYEACLEEIRDEPKFPIYDQLRLMERHAGQPSLLDKWLIELADYFLKQGRLDAAPDVTKFTTDEYMKITRKLMETPTVKSVTYTTFGVKKK